MYDINTIDLSAYIPEFNVSDIIVEFETEDLVSELCNRTLTETDLNSILNSTNKSSLFNSFYEFFEPFIDSCTKEDLLEFKNYIESKLDTTKESKVINSILKVPSNIDLKDDESFIDLEEDDESF